MKRAKYGSRQGAANTKSAKQALTERRGKAPVYGEISTYGKNSTACRNKLAFAGGNSTARR